MKCLLACHLLWTQVTISLLPQSATRRKGPFILQKRHGSLGWKECLRCLFRHVFLCFSSDALYEQFCNFFTFLWRITTASVCSSWLLHKYARLTQLDSNPGPCMGNQTSTGQPKGNLPLPVGRYWAYYVSGLLCHTSLLVQLCGGKSLYSWNTPIFPEIGQTHDCPIHTSWLDCLWIHLTEKKY